MHLVIPYAAPPPDDVTEACTGLHLPALAALRARLAPGAVDAGDEYTLSPPHERAHARALGWTVRDGLLPWAALAAAADGIDVGAMAWGLVVPAHWQLGRDRVTQLDPAALALGDDESRAYCDAVRPSFAAEGWTLRWGAALRWYVAHDSLADLACASLDRVVGRNVDLWLARSPNARLLRRLQAEVQMLLHDHPLNVARDERGTLTVNSFWLSGCGRPAPAAAARAVWATFSGASTSAASTTPAYPATSTFPTSPTSPAPPASATSAAFTASATSTASALSAASGLPAPSTPPAAHPDTLIDARLRAPQLAHDWAAWRAAWQELDAGPVAALLAGARRGESTVLTLCGDRSGADLGPAPWTGGQRLARALRRRPPVSAVDLLGSL